MKEFMFYIRNAGDAKMALSADEHLAFIKKCEAYIERLKNKNLLIAAQPIIREGCILSKNTEGWIKTPIDPHKEVQVGYYHICANNIDEAVEIAKENPEFEYVPSATIEIRPIKMKEEETNFTYPSNNG
ncbi:YciI family protein [Chryseobacterium sp. IT-36CA2]|uniref:YciI family protein n=1 Tax=Chryseobacterium sp. IT-36CA2 TaxID=3026460 RepID=UPI0039E06CFE